MRRSGETSCVVARLAWLLVGVAALGAWSWPDDVHACTCLAPRGDINEQLRTALDEADAVLLGRAVAVREGVPDDDLREDHTTTFQVTEWFKGEASPVVELPSGSGGGADCTVRYEVGADYLIYADRYEGYLLTSLCRRTRRIDSPDDPELEWLRSRRPLPIPVALRRGLVRCDRCDAHAAIRDLLGLPGTADASAYWMQPRDTQEALTGRRKFWTTTAERSDPTAPARSVGLSAALRPFELVETSTEGEPCSGRVRLRWCQGLEAQPFWSFSDAIRCVDPGPELELCDEGRSRTVTTGPLESIALARGCSWRDPARPDCELPPGLLPLREGEPTAPYLECRPRSSRGRQHECRLVERAPPPAR